MANKYILGRITRNDRAICNKLNIYNISHLRFIQTKINDEYLLTEQQYKDTVLEHSNNAYELIKLYNEYINESKNYYSLESVINDNFSSIKKQDFIRYSDKNLIDKNIKVWFNSKAENIDTKLQEINQVNNIQIQDVIDFILKYKPNSFQNEFQIKSKIINERFKQLFGFNIKKYYVNHILSVIEKTHYFETECPF